MVVILEMVMVMVIVILPVWFEVVLLRLIPRTVLLEEEGFSTDFFKIHSRYIV
jgi:hypothetical protein